jgi:hypothetical protein
MRTLNDESRVRAVWHTQNDGQHHDRLAPITGDLCVDHHERICADLCAEAGSSR